MQLRTTFTLMALSACAAAARAPRDYAVRDPLDEDTADIPQACLDEREPEHPLACPPPEVLPPGACVVSKTDRATGRLIERFTLVAGRLTRAEQLISLGAQRSETREYDARGHLVEQLSCLEATGAGEVWSPSYQPAMVYWDAPSSQLLLTRATWDGDRPALVVTVATYGGPPADGYVQRLCYRYDEQGRRVRRYQLDRGLRGRGPVNLGVHAMHYDGAVRTLYTMSSYLLEAGRWRRQWTHSEVFVHDAAGRLVRQGTVGMGSVGETFTYDEAGRLSSWGGVHYTWDSAGHLVGRTGLGEPRLEAVWTYEPGGRLAGGSFGDGNGFDMHYGADCPADAHHELFTPGVDGALHYEGKDTF